MSDREARELVEVTQDDRDAAAAFVGVGPTQLLSATHRRELARLTEAFARHRRAALTRTAPSTEGKVEEEYVCAQCKGFRGELARGRDPEELCEPCYHDALSSLTPQTLPAVEALTERDVKVWMRANGVSSITLVEDVDAHLATLHPKQDQEKLIGGNDDQQ